MTSSSGANRKTTQLTTMSAVWSFSMVCYFCVIMFPIYLNRMLPANLKHLPPIGINSIVTQQTRPKQTMRIASGSLTNSQIAADSNAPVMWKPSQKSRHKMANVIIISIISAPSIMSYRTHFRRENRSKYCKRDQMSPQATFVFYF